MKAAVKRVVSEFKSQGVDFIMSVLNLQKRWSGEEKTARLEVRINDAWCIFYNSA